MKKTGLVAYRSSMVLLALLVLALVFPPGAMAQDITEQESISAAENSGDAAANPASEAPSTADNMPETETAEAPVSSQDALPAAESIVSEESVIAEEASSHSSAAAPAENEPEPQLLPAAEDTGQTAIIRYYFPVTELFWLEQGGDIQSIAEQLPTEIGLYYSRFRGFSSTVTWQLENFDSSFTGRQNLYCKAVIPEGYAYYDDEGRQADILCSVPVFVSGPGAETTEQLWLPGSELNNLLYPVGTSSTQVSDEVRQILADNNDVLVMNSLDGLDVRIPIQYDDSLVDTQKAGLQHPFTLQIPQGMELLATPLKDLYLRFVDPDAVDLSAPTFDMRNDLLRVFWLHSIPEATVWVMENADPTDEANADLWQEEALTLQTPPWSDWYAYNERLTLRSNEVCLSLSEYEPGIYHYQVRYGEGFVSNILTLETNNDGIVRVGTTDGNTDGGDADGDKPPVLEQPGPSEPISSSYPASSAAPVLSASPAEEDGREAPETTEEDRGNSNGEVLPSAGTNEQTGGMAAPTSQNASMPEAETQPTSPPVSIDTHAAASVPSGATQAAAPASSAAPTVQATERVSETETTVTGLRLAEMLARQPGGVLFQKEGISLWLDVAFLKSLDIDDDDTFTVELENKGQSFWIGVKWNGKPLGAITGTRVQVWYTWPSGAEYPKLTNANGNVVTKTSYNAEQELLEFWVDEPGLYRISAEATATPVGETAHGQIIPSPLPPQDGGGFSAGVLAAIGGGAGITALGCMGILMLRRRSFK
ncbi:hypothetical protein LJC49_09050 [Ruminococcaceae bacterium OttesenSCG-928-I18]|nr:hypothetical protein [Ruminococcaceae bacterium OttesenSCG-928-I18]